MTLARIRRRRVPRVAAIVRRRSHVTVDCTIRPLQRWTGTAFTIALPVAQTDARTSTVADGAMQVPVDDLAPLPEPPAPPEPPEPEPPVGPDGAFVFSVVRTK